MDRTNTSALLDEVLRRLRQDITGLRKVIVFGSRARGAAAADSDLDLIVVVEGDLPRSERYVRVSRLLRGLGVAVDLIVQSPGEHEANASKSWSVTAQAARHGRVLYEAA